MKSFEELYNEFKQDTDIKKYEHGINEEISKRKKVSSFICLLLNSIIIFYYIYINAYKSFITTMTFLIPTIFVNLIILVITTAVFGKKQREFIPVFKEKTVKKMISNFFTNLEYFPNKKMLKDIYREGKYESYDNYYSDDYVEAKIDNKYLIDMAEVHTEREETYTDSDGDTHTRTYTVFHGIFSKIIMEKSINSDLRIVSNYGGYKNKLEMDSSEFEKKFDVFASDKIIGMQILTADIMEEILDFKNKIKEDFDIYINDKNIYLRFHCGSMFEPIIRKKQILDEKSLNMYYNILKFTYELSNKLIKTIEETEI